MLKIVNKMLLLMWDVIMSPLTRAHQHLPDRTVKCPYSEGLIHKATAKPLLECICIKNGWDVSIAPFSSLGCPCTGH